MNSNKLMSGLYNLSEWISRLAYLNILWILFTLSGFVVLGVFPATVALFAINRKWVRGEESIPIFKTYWNKFKTNFGKSQLIGYTLVIIGAILYYDYQFFSEQDGVMFFVVKLLTGSVIFLYIMVALYIFPVFVHFDLKSVFTYIKNALLIGLSHLLYSIIMIIGTAILMFGLFNFSGLIIIFGISLPVYWITSIANNVFKRVELIKARKE